MVVSTVSGMRLLPDEVEYSMASGKPALPAELVACEGIDCDSAGA